MNPEQKEFETETIHGAIVVFTKGDGDNRRFLLINNTKSGNTSFVSGAREAGDSSNNATAEREIEEEIGLKGEQYTLQESAVHQKFTFNKNKPERAGKPGDYQVFFAVINPGEEIQPTDEVNQANWLTKEDVRQSLSFPDLKEVFTQAINEQGW